MRPRQFSLWLQQNRWIYKRAGNRALIPYQEKIQAGYLDLKITNAPTDADPNRVFSQTMILPKGLAKLAEIFNRAGKEVAA